MIIVYRLLSLFFLVCAKNQVISTSNQQAINIIETTERVMILTSEQCCRVINHLIGNEIGKKKNIQNVRVHASIICWRV